MNSSSRGFVLSISLFLMAVFLVSYAQLYSDSLVGKQLDQSRQWDSFLPARLAEDAGLDLLPLMGQGVVLDRNTTNLFLTIQGELPPLLPWEDNLLAYQSSLSQWAIDQNVRAFLDLNQMIDDGNLSGTLSHGYAWDSSLDGERVHFYPTIPSRVPLRIDLNVIVESSYTGTSPFTLAEDGNTFLRLRYVDQNSSHTSTVSGYLAEGDLYAYGWTYGNGSTSLQLNAGNVGDVNGSILLDHNGASSFSVEYSVRFYFDANADAVRVGYALPLSFWGADVNTLQDVQWVDE
ncbi:MAG: hypothetical protein AABW68_04915 [archaeon]